MFSRRHTQALLVCLAAGPLLAQNSTTSLRGVITDATGAVVGGAHVLIENPATGTKNESTTNRNGEYQFQQVAPGKYNITVTAPGFGTYKTSASLLVAQPATVDASLKVNVDVTQVDVSTTTETINTTDATIGNAINNETIMALPSEGRNPQTLLALQPGVLYLGNTDTTDSRSGAVSGARPDQTNITLDGVDNNDQFAPAAFSGVLRTTLDATEEFRVTTSNANADTGRSSGGQVNLVTKAGTNQIHGSLYEYNRSNLGVANDPFVKAGQLASGLPNNPGHLIRNTYGISLGGPLKRDRIFLFGNYEGDRINQAVARSRTVPTASLRAGSLKYVTNDAAGNSSVVTLSPGQVASMDTGCGANSTCPSGPGPNPASLALFGQYPLNNGTAKGDRLNSGSYTFAGSDPQIHNVYISRLDINPSDRHRFYIRGSFQNDKNSDTPWLPGQAPNYIDTDDSRGLSGNYTYTVTANLVNNLRYGYTRQSFARAGAGNGSYVDFRSFDLPESSARSYQTFVPQHNVIDDVTWTRGKHTVQGGGNVRTYNYQNSTNANSFAFASSNPYWLLNSGFAPNPDDGSGGSLDPAAFGFAPVANNVDYNFAAAALVGVVPEASASYNYKTDGQNAVLLAPGAKVARSFRASEVEYYLQDTFRPSPNVTITAGIRHTILQTPYEINGQQVQPTIDIHNWFNARAAGAAQGVSVQPPISFAPSGKANGGKPYYPMNWGNIAPRIAFAFSPAFDDGSVLNRVFGGAGKSSIRAGFGIYYDHFGEGLISNFSQRGSFGLSSQLMNPASSVNADTSPRFTGLHDIPGLIPAAPATITFPQTPSTDPNGTGFAITTGIDDRLKTPYSEVFNFSLQRQLKGGFTLETDYVGRLGRHLLQSLDLAQPLDLVDPRSGQDYYTAGTLMSQYVDQGLKTVPNVPFFENTFANAARPAKGLSATQNIYNSLWRFLRGNETAALELLDVNCTPGCYNGQTGQFWPLQYSSLYSTASIGNSSYNAGQVILRHPISHGVQFDVSYTYSRSLDMGSDSETNIGDLNYGYGNLQDAFNPRKNYALSDFNTTHLFTGDWNLLVPYGRGRAFGGGASRLIDGVFGGWSLAGIARLSSGLPFSIIAGGWSTNWESQSYVVQTGPIKYRKHYDASGVPQLFDDPAKAAANLRAPYPGEVGERNRILGDGYFDVDSGLHKAFALGEKAHFSFAWEVFNVSNSVRYDVHYAGNTNTNNNLGVYSQALTTPRRMQFSGRIEF